MRTLPAVLVLVLAACNPSNSLSGPLAFTVENSGSIVQLDGGQPWNANIYIWGNVTDGGTELATVCSEVKPTGPVNSAIVPDLVALTLLGGPEGLATGSYPVGTDGKSQIATAVVALGADGNQPNSEWQGVGGSITLTSIDSTLILGTFELSLQALGNMPDAGSLSGSFAASPCNP